LGLKIGLSIQIKKNKRDMSERKARERKRGDFIDCLSPSLERTEADNKVFFSHLSI